MPRIKIVGSKVRFPIEDEPVVIGSGQAATIRILDKGVSERHAEVFREGGGFFIRDLDSEDGTLVNGQRISKQVLRATNQIVIGTTCLVFEDPGDLPEHVKDSGEWLPKKLPPMHLPKSLTEGVRDILAESERIDLFELLARPSGFSEHQRRAAVKVMFRMFGPPLTNWAMTTNEKKTWMLPFDEAFGRVVDFFDEFLEQPKKFEQLAKYAEPEYVKRATSTRRTLSVGSFRWFLLGFFNFYCLHAYRADGTGKRDPGATVMPIDEQAVTRKGSSAAKAAREANGKDREERKAVTSLIARKELTGDDAEICRLKWGIGRPTHDKRERLGLADRDIAERASTGNRRITPEQVRGVVERVRAMLQESAKGVMDRTNSARKRRDEKR